MFTWISGAPLFRNVVSLKTASIASSFGSMEMTASPEKASSLLEAAVAPSLTSAAIDSGDISQTRTW